MDLGRAVDEMRRVSVQVYYPAIFATEPDSMPLRSPSGLLQQNQRPSQYQYGS